MSNCTKTSVPAAVITMTAAEDMPAHRFIAYDGSLANTGLKSIGIADLDCNANDKIAITILGVMPVETGGPINIGDAVTSTAFGKALVAIEGEPINGRALDAATGADEFIRILLVA